MNTVFRIVWSHARSAWIVVCELARRSGKSATTVRARPTLAAIGLIGLSTLAQAGPPAANALPSGGQIVAGQGAITQSGSAMTVTQNSQKLIANWQSFDIGKNASVSFNQPNAASVALNRIIGQNPSQIFGSLTANGQVMLVNPSGIVFGPGSQVNVGSLVASTLNLSDQNFLGGNYRFNGGAAGSKGEIINQGMITANGGVVALLAPVAKNEGSIRTPQGGTVLAAGNDVSLDFGGDGLVAVTVQQSTLDSLAQNQGLIQAGGGAVILTAGAARDLISGAVNNTGIIEAKALAASNGRILLEGGTTTVSGTLDASGQQAGEHGGTVTLLGNKVGLFDGARVDVSGDSGGGTALIGGNWQGKGVEANAQRTYVAETVQIDASATGNGDGDGGKVVVWADDVTRYYGSVTAQGGALGGNGGQVEVSGKQLLDFNGRVDTTAAQGQGGVLLLDPKNIVVATADPGGSSPRSAAAELDAFTDNPTETSWITPAALVTLLNTAAVSLQAYNDITVSNAVDAIANVGNFGLTMRAGRSILINDSIKLRGAFAAYANDKTPAGVNRDAGAGDFTMATGTTIDTSNQNRAISIQVWTQNALGTATIKSLTSGSNNIEVTADTIELSGGADSISSTGNVTLKPTTDSRPLVIGAAGVAGDFALDATELATLKDGFDWIQLGSSGTGSATLFGALSFKDGVTIYNAGAGGSITLDGSAAVNANGNFINFVAGSGNSGIFTQANGATIDAGAGNIVIRADSIALNGAANSISGSAIVTFLPLSPARPMVIGAAGTVNDFALETNELATLKDGFILITLAGVNAANPGGLTMSGPLSFWDTVIVQNDGVGSSITLDASAAINTNGNSIEFYAGSGNAGVFTQANGATLTTGNATITIMADVITLNGAPDSISSTGNLALTPTTDTRPIDLGADDTAGLFALNASEILTLKNGFTDIKVGSIDNWGSTHTGGLTISRALTFNDTLKLDQAAGGSFTVNATPTVSGALKFIGAAPVALNASVSATTGVEFAGAVTLGANDLSVGAGTGTATFSSTLAHGTNAFTVTADDVALSGNWTGTGARTLQPATPSQNIGLAGWNGAFSLDATELGYLNFDTPALVTIGRSGGTGAISTNAINFGRPLALRGGSITQTAAWTIANTASLTSSGNITLAQSGNDFGGTLSVAGNNISLRDTNALQLGATTAAGTLTLQTGGALTQSGDLAVTGASVITAGANDVTLDRVGNNFGGAVRVASGKDVSLRDTNDLLLGPLPLGSFISGNLTLQTGGALTQNINNSYLQVAGTTSITAGANDVTLDRINNDFSGAVTVVSGKNVILVDKNAMTLGAVTSSGLVEIATRTLDLTLTSAITTSDATANAIKLNAGRNAAAGTATGGNIIISGGSLSYGAGGSATLYTGSVAGSTGLTDLLVSGSGRFRYNSDEAASRYTTALLAGSNAIYRERATVITTALNDTKTYSGVAYSGGNGVTYGGFANGDTSAALTGALVYGGSSQGAVNAGGYGIVPSGYSNGLGYTLAYVNGALTIDPAALTVVTGSLTGSISKVYDGTTTATLASGNYLLSGFVANEGATVTKTSGSYDTANAGSNKTVTVSLADSDYAATGSTNLGNYSLPTTVSGAIGAITAKPLTANDITAANKVYDGTTTATLNTSAAALVAGGVIGSDAVTLNTSSASGAFADKNVGNNKAVTVSGLALSGDDAGNYTVSDASAATANITARAITTNGITAADKVYDGTTTATLNVSAAALQAGDVISGDAVRLNATGASGVFGNKNVGAGKAVTVSGLVLTGSEAGNYTVSDASGATADISSVQNAPPLLPPSAPVIPAPTPINPPPLIDGVGGTPAATLPTDNTSVTSGTGTRSTGSGSDPSSLSRADAGSEISRPSGRIDFNGTGSTVALITGVSGLTATLFVAESGNSPQADTATEHPVFRQQGNVLTAVGGVLISERGPHWVATSSETREQQPPSLQGENIRLISVPLTLPNNIQSELSVGFRGDGVLIIKAPSEVRQAYEERQILLLAMVSANKRMNVERNNVTAIIFLKDDVGR